MNTTLKEVRQRFEIFTQGHFHRTTPQEDQVERGTKR